MATEVIPTRRTRADLPDRVRGCSTTGISQSISLRLIAQPRGVFGPGEGGSRITGMLAFVAAGSGCRCVRSPRPRGRTRGRIPGLPPRMGLASAIACAGWIS